MYDFKLLKPISSTLYVLGMVVAVLSVLGGIGVMSSSPYGLFSGICIALGGFVFGVLILAASCLINLLLQIEENTHKNI